MVVATESSRAAARATAGTRPATAELGALGVGQRLARVFEVGAGVLQAGIQEEFEQVPVEVVAVGDVLLRPLDRIVLADTPDRLVEAVEGDQLWVAVEPR